MKKSVVIAAGAVAVVAAAYPAVAWMLGRQMEAALGESYLQLGDNPNFKMVKRDYQRGVFSATEVVTFELFGNLSKFSAMQKPAGTDESPAAEGAPAPMPVPSKPIQLTFRTEIKHGPFPGFSAFGAAVADTELVSEGEAAQAIAKLMGDKKPLEIHAVYGFGGGGVARLTSPAFTTTVPGKEGQGAGSLSWDGLTMSMDFAKGLKAYSFQADMPKLEFKDGEGGHGLFSGLHLQGDQKRLFDDTPMFYTGNLKATLSEFNLTPKQEGKVPVVAKQIAYEVGIPAQGDFIDIIGKMGADVLQVGEQSFGPAHYDFSFIHLQARSAADFYRAWMKIYSSPAALAAMGPGGRSTVFAPLNAPAVELLKHEPEIRIDRLSFTSKDGEARLSARASLKGAKPDDFSMPAQLIAHVQANADISVPEAVLAQFGGVGQGGPEEAAGNFAEKLAGLEAQGFLVREGGVVKSKLEFANGQLTVNGKVLAPGMQAAPQ